MRVDLRRLKTPVRVVGILVFAMSLSGCYRAVALLHQQESPDTRPSWCESELMEGDPGAEHYLDRGIEKGMLSWDDCLAISGYFDDAVTFALQWPTRGQAEAAGWRVAANYATGMGTHHALGNPLEGSFNPSRPTFLQYDGNGPNAKLVGLSWYVHTTADMPPEGFPGDNDWFHTHEYLCVNGSGVVIRDGRCQTGDNGSTVYLGDYWLL